VFRILRLGTARATNARMVSPSAPATEPVKATEREKPDVQRLEAALAAPRGKLVGPKGPEVTIPGSVYALLRRIVHELGRGNAVTVVPVNAELTTQQAADLLNVSRPHVIKLLEERVIPFRKVGTHRRIRFDDLMAYRRQRTTARREALMEMARQARKQRLPD